MSTDYETQFGGQEANMRALMPHLVNIADISELMTDAPEDLQRVLTNGLEASRRQAQDYLSDPELHQACVRIGATALSHESEGALQWMVTKQRIQALAAQGAYDKLTIAELEDKANSPQVLLGVIHESKDTISELHSDVDKQAEMSKGTYMTAAEKAAHPEIPPILARLSEHYIPMAPHVIAMIRRLMQGYTTDEQLGRDPVMAQLQKPNFFQDGAILQTLPLIQKNVGEGGRFGLVVEVHQKERKNGKIAYRLHIEPKPVTVEPAPTVQKAASTQPEARPRATHRAGGAAVAAATWPARPRKAAPGRTPNRPVGIERPVTAPSLTTPEQRARNAECEAQAQQERVLRSVRTIVEEGQNGRRTQWSRIESELALRLRMNPEKAAEALSRLEQDGRVFRIQISGRKHLSFEEPQEAGTASKSGSGETKREPFSEADLILAEKVLDKLGTLDKSHFMKGIYQRVLTRDLESKDAQGTVARAVSALRRAGIVVSQRQSRDKGARSPLIRFGSVELKDEWLNDREAVIQKLRALLAQ